MITKTPFDNLLDSFFNPNYLATAYKPTVNTDLRIEKDVDLFVKVPGCSNNDVDVEVDEKYISVKAKSNVEGFDFDLEKKYIVPTNIDRDKLTAVVKDGLLKIELKRKHDTVNVKKLL